MGFCLIQIKMLQKFYHHFLFLLFSMCHYAVNWCDKLRFFAFLFAVLLPNLVTGQG